MKRYTACPVCRRHVLIEYGNVLREHERPQIAPGGMAPKFPAPLCRGPRTPTPPASEPDHGQPSGGAVQAGGARGASESSTRTE